MKALFELDATAQAALVKKGDSRFRGNDKGGGVSWPIYLSF